MKREILFFVFIDSLTLILMTNKYCVGCVNRLRIILLVKSSKKNSELMHGRQIIPSNKCLLSFSRLKQTERRRRGECMMEKEMEIEEDRKRKRGGERADKKEGVEWMSRNESNACLHYIY